MITPETVTTPEGQFKRVSKTEARKLYTEGQTIWLVPSHVRFSFDHQWVRPFEAQKGNWGTFTKLVTAYKAYNCLEQLGTYPKFYIKLEKGQQEDNK